MKEIIVAFEVPNNQNKDEFIDTLGCAMDNWNETCLDKCTGFWEVVDREEKQGVFPDEIPSSSSVSSPTKEVTPLLSRMKCAFPDKNKNTTHDDYVLWADVLCCLKEFKEAYYIEVLRDKEYPEWAYNDFCKMVKRFFGGEEK